MCCVAAQAAPLVDLRLVAGNLTNITCIANARDGSGRLFVTEQPGQIKVITGTNVPATPFLDIRPLVLTNSNERGLLGVAFHPGFATNGMFYVYFTAQDTSNMVARFTASPPSAGTVNTNTMLTVLRLPHPGQNNHNGGDLQFGPDGYLYIGPGDGGSGCDPPNNAQTLASPLGKLLRIDVNNFSTNYTIPPSNPFVATNGAHPEIWAYGLRNPWRFSFDRATGDLWIGDVGQSAREEIDFQSAGSAGGQNYGWRLYEGFLTNTCSVTFSNVPTVLPVFDYSHVSGACAITGGYRYRGRVIAPLIGTYVYGDECSGQIWGLTQTVLSAWINTALTNVAFNISTFGEDENGELYVAKYAVPGALYRIVARDSVGDGLPDWWRQQYFTGDGTTTNSRSCATCDADGTGQNNLFKYAAGLDPTNPASVFALSIADVDSQPDQMSLAGNPLATGRTYTVQFNTDLLSGTYTNLTGFTGPQTNGNQLAITDLNAGPSNKFYRVRISFP
jgi:hypothetical protein